MKLSNFMFSEESEHKVTIFFFFLNFDTVFENSTLEHFANIFRTERDGVSVIEFETARIHFISEVFVTNAIVHPSKGYIYLRAVFNLAPVKLI